MVSVINHSIFLLCAAILNTIMLSVFMVSVFNLSIVLLCAVIPIAFMLSVIVLSVMAPLICPILPTFNCSFSDK